MPITNKIIALTFDDGPAPGTTEQILAILAQNNVKATFFQIGSNLAPNAALGRAIRDAGHAIGNHTWSHLQAPTDPNGEVAQADEVIKSTYGGPTGIFRPPFGDFDNGVVKAAQAENDAIIVWSVDPQDWSMPGTDSIVNTVLNGATPGGIVLMHDGGGDRSQTIAALPRIIAGLRAQGYTFATVPELLALAYPTTPTRSGDAVPVLTISDPGVNYSYGSLTATGTARDTSASVAVTSVGATLRRFSDALYWNGSAWAATPTSLPATLGAASGTSAGVRPWNLPLSFLTDGRYTLAVTATDAANGVSVPLARDFWIDNLAPVTVIVTPANGATLATPGTATGTASDGAGGGVNSLVGALMRSDGSWWTGTQWQANYSEIKTPFSGATNWNYSLAGLSAGSYSLYVCATDYVGNRGTWARSDFTITAGSGAQGRTLATSPSAPSATASKPAVSSGRGF